MQDLPSALGHLPRYDEDSEKDVRYIHVRAISVRQGEGPLHKKTQAGHETVGDFRYVS